MPYVERLQDGAIKGLYANLQPGQAEEFVADDSSEVVSFLNPPRPPFTQIRKNLIWSRATDDEAEQMEAALQSQPVRIRRIYEGATFISTTDELYGVLEAALVQMFGAERAAELLEPTG